MKHLLALAILTLAITSAPAADYLDRTDVLKGVAKRMEELDDEDKLIGADKLLDQLKRRSCPAKLARPAKRTLSPEAVYEKNRDAVLMIVSLYKCGKCSKWHSNAASGFLVTKDGIALTNYHVMESKTNKPVAAVTYDGKIHRIMEVLAADNDHDIAVIKIEGNDFPYITLSPKAPVGSAVSVISHPRDHLYYFSQGAVSDYFKRKRTKKSPQKVGWMSITADYGKGSSGAPVFDKYGNAVGMVSSTSAVIADLHGDEREYAQMVVKQCVPTEAILKLFE